MGVASAVLFHLNMSILMKIICSYSSAYLSLSFPLFPAIPLICQWHYYQIKW